MTIEEAINVLRNTAWLGTEKDRENVEKAIETLSNFLEIPNSTAAYNGRWIFHQDWKDEGECPYECNWCGRTFDYDMNYCGYCGAYMKEKAK